MENLLYVLGILALASCVGAEEQNAFPESGGKDFIWQKTFAKRTPGGDLE